VRAIDQQSSLGECAGNVPLSTRHSGLTKDSVANISQIVLDKSLLTEIAGKIPRAKLELILSGIDVMSGRRAAEREMLLWRRGLAPISS
jgi:hypothetical protein